MNKNQINVEALTPEQRKQYDKAVAMKRSFKGIFAQPPAYKMPGPRTDPNNPNGARKPRRRK